MALLLSACGVTSSETSGVDVAQPSDWQLIWNDEFDPGPIDPNRWEHEIDCAGGGNNEAQCYTNRPENAFIDADGILHIVAREERFSGPAHSMGSPDYRADDRSATRDFTSARLRSVNRLDFKYGRIEVRAKLPAGAGTWPAIWMLPTDWVYGGWPSSGEIDIMEAINLDDEDERHSVHGTLHYGLKWPQWSVAGADYLIPGSATRDFRTYTLEWEADEMRWYVDGVHYQTQTSDGWYNYIWQGQQRGFEVASKRAPFDQRFHLLLNLAIGGHAPGPPDRGWPAPRELQIDYVRVYQCPTNPQTGSGCATPGISSGAVDVIRTTDSGAPKVNRFRLFGDQLETLSLASRSGESRRDIKVESSNTGSGSATPVIADSNRDDGSVLAIDFENAGAVVFTADKPATEDAFGHGFALAGDEAWRNFGTLEFDLQIKSLDPDVTLLATLGDTTGGNAAVPIETSAIGSWQPVRIRISDLLAQARERDREINFKRLDYLLGLSTRGDGATSIAIDNVELTCAVNENAKNWQPAPNCSIGPAAAIPTISDNADIFVDRITRWRIVDCCDGASVKLIDDTQDTSRGKVAQISYQGDASAVSFESRGPIDISAMAGGTLEFDLRILSQGDGGTSAQGWRLSSRCGEDCGSGDLTLADRLQNPEVLDRWQRVIVKIDDLVAGGLLLEQVTAPLVLYPVQGEAVIQVDNVVLRKPALGAIQLTE